MIKHSLLAAAAAIGLSATAPAEAANLLINGSFETRVVMASDLCQGGAWCVRDFASTPGWTQIFDGVDLVNNNYVQAPGFEVLVDASDGINFLDMNQANAIGGIEQTVGATIGQVFTLSLDTTAWARNAIGGIIGYELYNPGDGSILASGSYQDDVGGTWITRTLSAAATSSSIGVRIRGIRATQAGMGVDNVALTASDVGAVPEPATWTMMIFGFGLVGFGLRRRGDSRAQVQLSAPTLHADENLA